MTVKLAFAGFRHGHIMELYNLARQRDGVEVVAAAEEHGPTREAIAQAGKVRLTHDDYDALLASDFDALAVGDYYGRRGELAIRALSAGRHVIVDKPLCTTMHQLDEIARLARDNKLAVGCMLTTRDSGGFNTLRELIAGGRIGQVHTVNFTGQHPLLRPTRASWYFESPAHHGGTLNDIAIHAFDAIGWLTGRRIVEIVAARVWNGGLTQPAWFQVGGQVMCRLDNDGGVLGDVSYLAPTAAGYKSANYWRYLIHGSEGQVEAGSNLDGIMLTTHADKQPVHVPAGPARTGSYFDGFLGEIAGADPATLPLTTAEVLSATRTSLLAQQAAEQNRTHVTV